MSDDKVTFTKRDMEKLLNQLSTDLTASQARVASLEATNEAHCRCVTDLTAQHTALESKLTVCRDALRPFAECYDYTRNTATYANTVYCGALKDPFHNAAAVLAKEDNDDKS